MTKGMRVNDAGVWREGWRLFGVFRRSVLGRRRERILIAVALGSFLITAAAVSVFATIWMAPRPDWLWRAVPLAAVVAVVCTAATASVFLFPVARHDPLPAQPGDKRGLGRLLRRPEEAADAPAQLVRRAIAIVEQQQRTLPIQLFFNALLAIWFAALYSTVAADDPVLAAFGYVLAALLVFTEVMLVRQFGRTTRKLEIFRRAIATADGAEK